MFNITSFCLGGIILRITIIILLTIILFAGCSAYDTNEETTEEPSVNYLIEEFGKRVIQEIGQNYKVKDFDNKEELINYIAEVTTRDIAENYVDMYYEQKNDSLYIIPTEGPMWIDVKQDYQVQKMSSEEYKIIQEGENQLWGTYRVEAIIKKIDGSWLIAEIETKSS